MRLPARRLHHGGDCCTCGLSEQRKDRLLLGPAAGCARARVRPFHRLIRAVLGARKLGFLPGFALQHFGSLSVVTTPAPSPPTPRNGAIASGAGIQKGLASPIGSATLTLQS